VSALLEVSGLSVHVPAPRAKSGRIELVADVGFAVEKGGTLGIVGESGSGKTVSVLAILRLIDGATTTGTARFDGLDLLAVPDSEMRSLRGRRVAMVFQDPSASLNPALRVGDQIGEPLRVHERLGRAARRERAIELLRTVGVPEPEMRVDAWPHQLSGGLKQRAMIAMAIACGPELLVADEPTTALDVTVQAQVIDLLGRLRRERGMGMLLISHDLGLVAETSDHVAVMYAGRVVERGSTRSVLSYPRHPYTAALLASTPTLSGDRAKLRVIEGTVPDITRPPTGCRFHDRCAAARPECTSTVPPWVDDGEGGGHRCLFPLGGARP
jgi:peptide/nickel transport system ATP-binding protein